MSEVFVRLGQHSVAITLPDHVLRDSVLGGLARSAPIAPVNERIVVSEAADRTFTLQTESGGRVDGLKRGALLGRLLKHLATEFAERAQVPILRAAAVGWGDGAVLIAGPQECGKSSLAAWFIEKGFAFIADDQVAVVDGNGSLAGYPAPLTFAAAGADHLVGLADIAKASMVRIGERFHIGIKDEWSGSGESYPCGMMIFPKHVPDSRAQLEKLDGSAAARLLKMQATSAGTLGGDMDYWYIRMARDIPAVALHYSDYEQIEGVLDRLTRLAIDDKLSPSALDRFISGIGRPASVFSRQYPIAERSTRQFSPFMTIGMATYDDYDGVYFSLQAIRLYHPEILDEVEFLIIDNHPDGPCGAVLKDLEKHIPNLRYVPAGDVTGTAVRSRLFDEAGGEFVLCMDCHVLFMPGSLRKLIDYFRTVPLSRDLVQGPMIYDNLTSISTHWSEGWRGGMFGQWATEPAGENPDNPPFDIPLQGLGAFACRRACWPGFNPAFRGFGGEEGYIHEKFRRAGGRSLCLPALSWLHRFGRPMGQSYPNKWEDRIRNYQIGFRELGWNTDAMEAHFREHLGRQRADRIFAAIREELDGSVEFKAELRGDVSGEASSDEPYDLREARLQLVAEATLPILIENFRFESAACIGRGASLWARAFSDHGIPSSCLEPLSTIQSSVDHAAGLACCFEIPGISSAALAEKHVTWLTSIAPVIVFVFAQGPAGDPRHDNRLAASWAALFAKHGYKAIDCFRPALANDPRAELHYRRNMIVFSKVSPVRHSAVRPKAAGEGVSVVMPVYNGAAFLGQAIESVLLQTHRNLELIVVNDGSSDSSGAIADSYAKADVRVRVIHQDNGGEAAAANAGFAAAQFAFVARLDHDDVALPERLALQVAFLEKHEDIAVVGGALRHIDGEGKLTGGKDFYPLTPEACHTALANATVGPIGHPTVMMRKSAFAAIGGYRAPFRAASDLDLWLRMDERFKLANLPDMLVDYRRHKSNATLLKPFELALHAQIAKQAALLRRRGLPDPVDGWTNLELHDLAAFPMPDEERSQVYRHLFDAAVANFAVANEDKYLKLADNCLLL